jgi:hypothetical protein
VLVLKQELQPRRGGEDSGHEVISSEGGELLGSVPPRPVNATWQLNSKFYTMLNGR